MRPWPGGWASRPGRGWNYWYRPNVGWVIAGVGAASLAALTASAYYSDSCVPIEVQECQQCWPNNAGELICSANVTCRNVWQCQ